HTRWPRDWSSDVCSSDLPGSSVLQRIEPILRAIRAMLRPLPFPIMVEFVVLGVALVVLGLYLLFRGTLPQWLPSGYVDQAGKRRSEERRVGKEWRFGWSR